MKASLFFALLTSIYIAPNLTPRWRLGVATFCVISSVVFFVKETL